VIIGGQVGIVGHLTIADGALLAARSGIRKSIPKGGKYGGDPVAPFMDHQRDLVLLKNIKKHTDKIRVLEEKLAKLTSEETP
jgi:UDP-3-O-[3-hydroxymyristoyl] glucosamine N-acyltransferase